MHHDGGGLYLQITEGRSGINKSWLFRYTVGKKSRYLGLGIYPFVGLSDAREKAGHARKLLGQGIRSDSSQTRCTGHPASARGQGHHLR